MSNILIRDISAQNKPRERLIDKGAAALTDSELISLVISTGGKNISALGLADALLKKHGSLKNIFSLEVSGLRKEKNIGLAKASTICAVNEIAKRIENEASTSETTIKTPKDVFHLLRPKITGKKQEHLFLISLDSRKKVLACDLVSIGSVSEALFPQREILAKALERDAVSIVIAHNHPSNDVTPSDDDYRVTEIIDAACEFIGLKLLDHVIVAEKTYHSLKSTNLKERR